VQRNVTNNDHYTSVHLGFVPDLVILSYYEIIDENVYESNIAIDFNYNALYNGDRIGACWWSINGVVEEESSCIQACARRSEDGFDFRNFLFFQLNWDIRMLNSIEVPYVAIKYQ